MSRTEDLAAIREGYRAWNDGRPDALMHPDVEWVTPPEVPGGGTLVGREATLDFLRNFEGTVGVLDLSFEIEEIIPAGGRYLVISLAQGAGGSGVTVAPHHWFHLMTLEGGKLRRAELFLDRGQAFEAAGLVDPSESG